MKEASIKKGYISAAIQNNNPKELDFFPKKIPVIVRKRMSKAAVPLSRRTSRILLDVFLHPMKIRSIKS